MSVKDGADGRTRTRRKEEIRGRRKTRRLVRRAQASARCDRFREPAKSAAVLFLSASSSRHVVLTDVCYDATQGGSGGPSACWRGRRVKSKRPNDRRAALHTACSGEREPPVVCAGVVVVVVVACKLLCGTKYMVTCKVRCILVCKYRQETMYMQVFRTMLHALSALCSEGRQHTSASCVRGRFLQRFSRCATCTKQARARSACVMPWAELTCKTPDVEKLYEMS